MNVCLKQSAVPYAVPTVGHLDASGESALRFASDAVVDAPLDYAARAVAVHRGLYNRMNEAHDAIRKWMAANGRKSAGHSWEIYGDPSPNPADTETTVVYLLE